MCGVNFDGKMLDKILCVIHKSGMPQWLLPAVLSLFL